MHTMLFVCVYDDCGVTCVDLMSQVGHAAATNEELSFLNWLPRDPEGGPHTKSGNGYVFCFLYMCTVAE